MVRKAGWREEVLDRGLWALLGFGVGVMAMVGLIVGR